MTNKEFVHEFAATAATCLRLTKSIHGSGRCVLGDSWFGSYKACVALKEKGLDSIMLVKTAHKNYPKELLNETHLKRGDWSAFKTSQDGFPVQVCRFRDLKLKDFVSTCSTALAGNPRQTKHHGLISRPQVTEY